jgi:hypothetical protein
MRTPTRFQKFAEAAWRPCDVASLVVFRVACGLILLWEVTRFFFNGLIDSVYIDPPFHFTYLGFGWVRPLPGDGMLWLFLSLGIAALLLALGFCYRAAAAWSWLGWTYVLLLEKAAYLNHLYLVCLLCFLLIWLPLHRAWSLDAWRQPVWQSNFVPSLVLWILRAQIAIPYLFGAFAKLNGDWLRGQPMSMWMARMTQIREVIPFWGEPWMGLLFSWGGFLLDLLVVPALLWRPLRAWAFAAAVSFHLLNALMFRIGIFPWFMICATTLFFDPDWPRRLLRRMVRADDRVGLEGSTHTAALARGQIRPAFRRAVLAATLVWFVVQGLLPLHHWLYPGHVDWTFEGYRFAWRMMLNDRTVGLQLFAVDRASGEVRPIDPRPWLTPWQQDYLGQDPDLLLQFAHFLADELRRTSLHEVEIRAQVLVSLNGRKPQVLVDADVDLARQPRSLGPYRWVKPLTEPLAEPPWDMPASRWSSRMKIPEPTLPQHR